MRTQRGKWGCRNIEKKKRKKEKRGTREKWKASWGSTCYVTGLLSHKPPLLIEDGIINLILRGQN